MVLKATELRANIYKILDQVLASGQPVEIQRKGRRLRLSPVDGPSKLKSLKKRDVGMGNPQDLVHLDWSAEWKNDLP